MVEGGELFDRIVSKAHYTEKEARDLIKSLLETLNYMHTVGVVHRDLKPENLLLCSGNAVFFCYLLSMDGCLLSSLIMLLMTLIPTCTSLHTVFWAFADISLLLSSPVLGTTETDDADIKIADFGFAKRIADLLPKETACGTPGYVAPEILRGDRYGAEVDIWRYAVTTAVSGG